MPAFLIIIIVLAVMMYVLMIRPQRAQQRKHQEMLNNVKPGDEVVTIGGIYGDVVEVLDDKLVLEIAEGVHIEIARRAIGSVVPAEQLEDAEDDEEYDEDEAEVDEEPELRGGRGPGDEHREGPLGRRG
ncbi:MAG: preprotein translocase subunit YajC [Thermoleophilia bacterium]